MGSVIFTSKCAIVYRKVNIVHAAKKPLEFTPSLLTFHDYTSVRCSDQTKVVA